MSNSIDEAVNALKPTAKIAPDPAKKISKRRVTKPITTKIMMGQDFVVFSQRSDLRDNIQSIFSDIIGHNNAYYYRHIYPLSLLVKNYDELVSELIGNYGWEREHEELKTLQKIVGVVVEKNRARLQERLKEGLIEFDDLGLYFNRGEEIIINIGEPVAGILESAERKASFYGPYYSFKMKVITISNSGATEGVFGYELNYFGGLKDLKSLPVQKLEASVKSELMGRGKMFSRVATGGQYLQYSGRLIQSSWWTEKAFRAEGRVMIDHRTFHQVDPNQFDMEISASGIDFGQQRSRKASAKTEAMQIRDEDLWRTFPYVYGFSVKAKRWGKMAVSQLSNIEWRSDAFDKLVLDQKQKNLVKSLVEFNGNSFSDLIDGKGGGCIFLLHGPPGQGKTLTAEAVAELLKRPLYSISVGELGITPDELENRLRTILDVATVWNAVILLDEADIFLEARDEKDIQRNAMVGVFLRLLEYHQGVLFLTTNRVKNIDKAFYSRVSVALHFDDGGKEKRAQIWTNILQSAKLQFSETDINSLAIADLNGRQIKNVTRLAQTLSQAHNRQVDLTLIQEVIDLTTRFEREDRNKYDHDV